MRGLLGAASRDRPRAHGGERWRSPGSHRARSLAQRVDLRISACSVTCRGSRGQSPPPGRAALAEAGDGADREAPVRRRQRELVGAVAGSAGRAGALTRLEPTPASRGVWQAVPRQMATVCGALPLEVDARRTSPRRRPATEGCRAAATYSSVSIGSTCEGCGPAAFSRMPSSAPGRPA